MKLNVLKLMFRDFLKSDFVMYITKTAFILFIAMILTPIIVILFSNFATILPWISGGPGEYLTLSSALTWQFSSIFTFFGSMVAAIFILAITIGPIFIAFMIVMYIITKTPRFIRWRRRIKELYKKYDEELNGRNGD